MPSSNFVAPVLADVISSIHARPGSKTRGRSLSTNALVAIAQVMCRLPRVATASLAIFATLLTPLSAAASSSPRVTLSTTQGDIVLELDEVRAPQTVKNFLNYVDEGFYDNTLFHRVIEGFMIQGGGFNQNYQKKSTRAPVSNEAYNGLRNRHYTIAMARTTAPHSATSQFFINSEDNTNLDHTGTTQRGWGYTVFGRVVEGQDVVDAISRVHTGPGGPFSRDVPEEPVVILSASRVQHPEKAAAMNATTMRITAKTLPDQPSQRHRVGLRPIQNPSRAQTLIRSNPLNRTEYRPTHNLHTTDLRERAPLPDCYNSALDFIEPVQIQ